MKQMTAYRLFVLLAAALVMTVTVGCSEKTVNGLATGDSNIAIDIQASPAETMQLVAYYILTVSAADMDPVVDTLTLVDGRYVVGNIRVPIGEKRLFVLEGVRPALEGYEVIYRGQTVAAVRPGVVTTLNIVLRPVAPMVRLSPVQTDVLPAAGWTLDLSLYNLPPVMAVRVVVAWDRAYLQYPKVSKSETLGANVAMALNALDEGIEIIVADTAGGSLLDSRGHADLATLHFSSQSFVQAFPIPASAEILNLMAMGLDSDTIPTAGILFEDARARLLPIVDRIVTFPDQALNRVIRDMTYVPDSLPIMLSDIIGYSYLGFAERGVLDLTGLEAMINLTNLEMSYNSIADLSPVAALTRMRYLYAEYNQLESEALGALSGLIDLQSLNLSYNYLTGIGPLAPLVMLQTLDLSNQNGDMQIADISPLADMTQLRWLYLGNNDVVDVGALAGLPELRYLSLFGNEITNILPLVENPGIDSGDVVELWYNDALINDTIQQGYMQALRNRQVIIYEYPPGK